MFLISDNLLATLSAATTAAPAASTKTTAISWTACGCARTGRRRCKLGLSLNDRRGGDASGLDQGFRRSFGAAKCQQNKISHKSAQRTCDDIRYQFRRR